jgi:hypothetical protein
MLLCMLELLSFVEGQNQDELAVRVFAGGFRERRWLRRTSEYELRIIGALVSRPEPGTVSPPVPLLPGSRAGNGRIQS